MKFCKNLQRIVEISDPAYSPFFVNYRMLKKLIKELPRLVPTEEATKRGEQESANGPVSSVSGSQDNEVEGGHGGPPVPEREHVDDTDETTKDYPDQHSAAAISGGSPEETVVQRKEELGKSPGEIAFFKLLHSEFRKATFFFSKTQQEFEIREERARDGFAIIKKQPNSIMVNEQWSMMAKSVFRLYRDLLLLETYAIMAYCSFSKILKKHDKVTGHSTRSAFMTNVVNKANFAHYPEVLEMISRCEKLYDEVSQRLLQEGKEGLYEDERLFINMITRLNDQVLDTPDGEGAAGGAEARKEARRVGFPLQFQSQQKPDSRAVSTLRSLVEAGELRASAAEVSEEALGGDDDNEPVALKLEPSEVVDRKRSADNQVDSPSKRAKMV